METVAFVIACHEPDAKYLPVCLQALQEQAVPADMVLVVNDGSSPEVSKAMGPFNKSMPYLYVLSLQKVGIPHAFNAGIRLMCNRDIDWVNMFSADDQPMPDYVQAIHEHGADADILSIQAQVIDEKGNQGCRLIPPPCSLENQKRTQTIYGCSPFRRKLWEKHGLDESTPLFDWAFFLDSLASGARVKVLDKPLYRLMERPNSFRHQVIEGKEKELMRQVLEKRGMA